MTSSPVLQRLAQGLEHGRGELRRLVEEQDAAVGPGGGARAEQAAPAADERRHGRGVVRSHERRAPDQPARRRRACRRPSGRPSPRAPARSSRSGSRPGSRSASIVLPAPGGPSSSRWWPPAAATSSARAGRRSARRRRRGPPPDGRRGARAGLGRGRHGGRPTSAVHAAVQRRPRRASLRTAQHLDARDERGLAGVRARRPRRAGARRDRREDGGQHAAHRPHPAVEPELAEVDDAARPAARRRRRRRRAPRRRWRGRSPLPRLGSAAGERLTVTPALRPGPAGVDHGRAHPVARLGERVSGSPTEREGRQPGATSASTSTTCPSSRPAPTDRVRAEATQPTPRRCSTAAGPRRRHAGRRRRRCAPRPACSRARRSQRPPAAAAARSLRRSPPRPGAPNAGPGGS